MKTCKFLDRDFELGGTIDHLEQDKGKYKGIYIIVCPKSFQDICFDECSKAGRYKGKNPTITVEKLESKWVNSAEILYIGKSETSVGKRMRQHIEFWYGEAVPAWGGRIIAQLRNFGNLEVWYYPCEIPKDMEHTLLKEFESRYKQLPFANFKR